MVSGRESYLLRHLLYSEPFDSVESPTNAYKLLLNTVKHQHHIHHQQLELPNPSIYSNRRMLVITNKSSSIIIKLNHQQLPLEVNKQAH